MSDQIMDGDKFVAVGKPAWHELGKVFNFPISGVDAHIAMGGSYPLTKFQAGYKIANGTWIEAKDFFAIVRGATNKDTNERVFDFATNHYHIIQPFDIIKTFDEKVGVSIETMGFIQDGRKLFITWKLPNFEVVSGDEVQLYGTLMVGFDTLFSTRLNVGSVRVVCANTWVASLEEAKEEKKRKRGRGTIYSSKHTNAKLLYELGEWMGFVQENAEKSSALIKSLFTTFANTPIVHEKQASDLIYTAFPDVDKPTAYPTALRSAREQKIDNENEKRSNIRDGIYELFTGSNGIAIDATYWGLFNACTQYFNHEMPSKKKVDYSIAWGNRSGYMNDFATVLKKDIANRQ